MRELNDFRVLYSHDEALLQQIAENDKDEKIPQYTYCFTCQVVRPYRAHHCRQCNICVLKQDHHCPMINSCVGVYNHK